MYLISIFYLCRALLLIAKEDGLLSHDSRIRPSKSRNLLYNSGESVVTALAQPQTRQPWNLWLSTTKELVFLDVRMNSSLPISSTLHDRSAPAPQLLFTNRTSSTDTDGQLVVGVNIQMCLLKAWRCGDSVASPPVVSCISDNIKKEGIGGAALLTSPLGVSSLITCCLHGQTLRSYSVHSPVESLLMVKSSEEVSKLENFNPLPRPHYLVNFDTLVSGSSRLCRDEDVDMELVRKFLSSPKNLFSICQRFNVSSRGDLSKLLDSDDSISKRSSGRLSRCRCRHRRTSRFTCQCKDPVKAKHEAIYVLSSTNHNPFSLFNHNYVEGSEWNLDGDILKYIATSWSDYSLP